MVKSEKEKDLHTVPEVILLVLATIILATLGYSVAPVLSPFVLVGAMIYLLYPLRTQPLPRRILWLSVILFFIWFFDSIIGILAPFILAFIAAYMLNPLVASMEQRRVPRWLSSLVSVLLIVGIGVTGGLFFFPAVIREFQHIIAGSGVIASDLARLIETGIIFDILSDFGIPIEQARSLITDELMPKLEGLITALFKGLLGMVTGVSSLAVHVINIVIIPFLVFYLLLDYPKIMARFRGSFPPSASKTLGNIIRIMDEVFGNYLRGAVIVACIQGAISGVGLWLIGVDYPLVLGIMTGLLNFIPYVGLITSLVVSSIVAIIGADAVLAKVIAIILLYLSQKVLEATVLAPRIIGSRVGLHPVLLILCLLVFGHFLGLVGMLIAVPATALIIVAVKEWEKSRPPMKAGRRQGTE